MLLQGDRFYYIGEQARFALSAQQITKVTAEIDTASLPQQGALALTWQSDDLVAHSIRFQMLDAKSVKDTVRKARSLQTQIEDWQALPPKAEKVRNQQLAVLKSPNTGEVTSQPFSPFHLGTSLFLLFILWTISTVLALLTGSYPELVPFIYLMPAIGIVLQAIPSIRRGRQRQQQKPQTKNATAIQ